MFSTGVLWLFRLLHIGSGVFWVGAILVFLRFLFPTAKALGPAAGPFMDHMMRVLKLPQAMMGAGVVNVLSGLGLFWHVTLGFQSDMMKVPAIMVLGTGGLLAIVALIIGITVNRPTADKIGALGARIHSQGSPPTAEQKAEMERLQARIGSALHAVAGLLVLTVAAMALARYVN